MYIIDDEDYEYLDSSNEVKLAIYKKDGVGQKFKFKVDLSSGNVTYDGNEETKNEEKEKVINFKRRRANIWKYNNKRKRYNISKAKQSSIFKKKYGGCVPRL